MRKPYFLLFMLLLTAIAQAQIISFADVNFKNQLLSSTTNTNPNYYLVAADQMGNDIVVDTNGDGEIDAQEALLVYKLTVQGNLTNPNDPLNLTSLSGIEYFTNITDLNCADNQLTSLDVSALTNLVNFRCERNNLTDLNIQGITTLSQFYFGSNQLPNLDLSANTQLSHLGCDNNQITQLDLSQTPLLTRLFCNDNLLTTLDVSPTTHLAVLRCQNNLLTDLDLSGGQGTGSLHAYNNPLVSLNMKSGYTYSYQMLANLNLQDCPTLSYVCVDDFNLEGFRTKLDDYGYTNCNLNSYCSFVPGGAYTNVQGTTRFDAAADGCGQEDGVFPHLRISVSSGSQSGTFIANDSGDYSIALQAGMHTLTPVLEHPEYFAVSPTSVSVSLPVFQAPDPVQDFCVTSIGTHADLASVIIPIGIARPGFDAHYKILYRNQGNVVLSGQVKLTFMDALMDFVTASQPVSVTQPNELYFDYNDLLPFETRQILVTFNLNSPVEDPAVNSGDDLGFDTVIFPIVGDVYDADNFGSLKQKAVNSFDPNDKTCLEGTTVGPEMAGQYVHYMIRFENTGTAEAVNIVVKDMIDLAKFDIASLVPLDGSHDFYTRIKGDKVEFIFENIHLPFDDANNDGYVVFKIKTKPTLVLGDTFSNTASIYFDYNHPIVTEPAVTAIALLQNQDFAFESYFALYPNPATDVLQITATQDLELSSLGVYNVLGELVLAVPNARQVKAIDVSMLKTGTYFVKIQSSKGNTVAQFLKR
ncbi:T9SS type A sorting domain-containing protein [Flavobacterium caeni]|uniref:Conserved repeat domain-containing protein/Por secretion system C-terminal sorting domain-containing protein n=1 Tax=Flavobacterium caeni TaxID=490189 RepID=A0A1G5JPJ0_9FLAO|nr:T9SS type A sorting domain-containing protein [Flavobacterium caeni]SCY90303.1 conserved repeat domain-containing protein/Por secretion system C-terminal sorting domain-containing protein [Flavobacterium caeni]